MRKVDGIGLGDTVGLLSGSDPKGDPKGDPYVANDPAKYSLLRAP